MTKEEIIEMAKQSGCHIRNGHIYNQYIGSLDQMLKTFAKLVTEKAIEEALETKDRPVQVSPLEFVEIVYEKEHLIGRPIVWAQWPNKEKNT